LIVYVTLVIGLVWWIAAWAFGIKAFDAFLLTVFITVVAATVVIVKPFLDRLLRREPAPLEERGAAR
jgi:hydrogenase-4 membrane subunit HyfE